MSRYLVLAGCACLAVAGTALAQTATTPPAPPSAGSQHVPDPERQLERLSRKLDLAPGQQAQLRPILERRRQDLEAVRADTSLSPAERRAKAAQILRDSEQQIEAVLTDSQRQQWQALRQSMRQHHPGRAPAAAASTADH